MALAARHQRHPYSDYLALERDSSIKHEFVAGEIYAMAGGTPDHAKLGAAVSSLIRVQLPAGCASYNSDLRVRVIAADLTTYPDGTVICGPTVRAIDDHLAITNPVVLTEVTSKSTESYDRGDKLDAYKLLSSLREVLIVSHRRPHLTLHRLETDGSWSTLEALADETVELKGCNAKLRVDDVYAGGLEDAANS